MCVMLPGQLDVGNKRGALGPQQTVQVNVSDYGLVPLGSVLSLLAWEFICCSYYFNRIPFIYSWTISYM